MDKKARDILLKTYWSGKGWREEFITDPADHPGALRDKPGKHDWTFAAQWRGEDEYDEARVEEYFGAYLR